MSTRALLTLEAGEAHPASYELQPARPATIGRNRGNQIVLKDLHASRQHAEVYFHLDRWYVRDIEARNATRVNGKAISGHTPLPHDALVQIGRTALRFTVTSDEKETPPFGILPALDDHPSSFHLDETVLVQDELTVLCQFMSQALRAVSRRELILGALHALHTCLGQVVAGFHSLEPGEELKRVVLPEAAIDVQLSKTLALEIDRLGRAVWLSAARETPLESDSLRAFRDALGLPLLSNGGAVGALHVYKRLAQFTEREVRFCEILAGHLAQSLHVLRMQESLRAENQRLRNQGPGVEQLIGSSEALQNVRKQIERLAPAKAPVLIVGESGVGKELVALDLHRRGPRHAEPLVTVNAAAIPATLLESQLFGHRRGAYSGATADHRGFFEQADGGILFLDEVGELSLEAQGKLLRVIEGKSFQPLGTERHIQVDVRIVAATHRDLEEEVKAGAFREDLFYRLQGMRIKVPPLREHAEDIQELVPYFLAGLAAASGREVSVSPAGMKKLQAYSWPGNVRQLRTVLEYAVALCEGSILNPEDFALTHVKMEASLGDLNLENFEARAVREALKRTDGNLTQAARLLGISRDTLQNKVKKYGINRPFN
jgi:two-component system, NtrC family, response regulator HydG